MTIHTDCAVAISLGFLDVSFATFFTYFFLLTFCRHNGDRLWLKVEVILVKLMIVARDVVILKPFFRFKSL